MKSLRLKQRRVNTKPSSKSFVKPEQFPKANQKADDRRTAFRKSLCRNAEFASSGGLIYRLGKKGEVP
jgi:hypothetical protein